MKNKYVTEFEFETLNGDIFYFPLMFLAENNTIANDIVTSYKTGLNTIFKVRRHTKPLPIFGKFNLKMIRNYIDNNSRGKVMELKVDEWKFLELDNNPELDFNQHIDLVEIPDSFEDKTIAKVILEHKFPVFLRSFWSKEKHPNFFVINVVKAD